MNLWVSTVLRPILFVLREMNRSEDDQVQLEALKTMPLDAWLPALEQAGHPMTTGLWAEYLTQIGQNWRPPVKALTAQLLQQRRRHAGEDAPVDLVLDCAAEAYEALVGVDFSQTHEFTTPGSVLTVLHRLARAIDAFGYGLAAARIVHAVFLFKPQSGSKSEDLARFGIELAVRECLPVAAASFAVVLAGRIVDAADSLPERRLEAFDACEAAIERVAQCPEESAAELGAILLDLVWPRQELAVLRARLLAFVPLLPSASPHEVAAAKFVWPRRISSGLQKEWNSDELELALQRELDADEERFKLEPPPVSDRPQTGWLTWRVTHPTYQSVVPFADSFLKEANFDDLLLVLSHEVVHVYSLLGVLGLRLQCLRCAEFFHVAAQLPEGMPPVATMEEFYEQVCGSCAAPGAQNQRQLFHIEAAIELAAKAQTLQDIWTPWLEGLAVFGETAADPALDPDRVGPVGEAMRGLTAFYTDPEETGGTIAPAFRQAWTRAIKARGPKRLSLYFQDPHVPYFAGYMAVRAVVSAWRAKLGQPLASTSAFHLLLHATRFGTLDAIPDLSLQSDAFRDEAQSRMTAWVARLAGLPKEDIKMFLRPPGRFESLYAWEGSRLKHVPAEGVDAYSDLQDAYVNGWLDEAMRSLTRLGDERRIEDSSADLHDAVAGCRNEALNYLASESGKYAIETSGPVVNRFLQAGTILPIGQIEAKFYMNLVSGADFAELDIGLRTFQPGQAENTRSGHRLRLSVPRDEAHQIQEHYEQTGNPRITVTRIIDLHGPTAAGEPTTPLHFLTFRYGDWTETLSAYDPRVALDREQHDDFLAAATRRVHGDPFEKLYLGPRFVGHAAVVRAIDRVRSPGWPPELRPWQAAVLALSERFLEEAKTHDLRHRAANGLLCAVLKDSEVFDDPQNINFETLTERCPAERKGLVHALFQTAFQPGADSPTAAAVHAFAEHPPYFFSRGPTGWDVRAAKLIQGGDHGNGHISH